MRSDPATEGAAMTSSRQTTTDATSVSEGFGFHRVVVGIDGSRESVEAARQGRRLAAAGAEIELVSAYQLAPPIVGPAGGGAPPYDDEDVQREVAVRAVGAAVDELDAGEASTMVAYGAAWDVLLSAVGDEPDALLAVGSHGTPRLAGILMGSTATEVIHKAPSSVLVARAAGARFPAKIVVGVDGSERSAAAFTVARAIAQRFDAKLWPVIAHGGDPVDTKAAVAIAGSGHEDMPDDPATALVAAAAEADLLVVGSRGLHGLKALGSVSERVAHRARCSVLIVRSAEDV
jgi:nucleotide-binding universal stress UspA family protein